MPRVCNNFKKFTKENKIIINCKNYVKFAKKFCSELNSLDINEIITNSKNCAN